MTFPTLQSPSISQIRCKKLVPGHLCHSEIKEDNVDIFIVPLEGRWPPGGETRFVGIRFRHLSRRGWDEQPALSLLYACVEHIDDMYLIPRIWLLVIDGRILSS